jgi:hypothetical protein
VGFGKKPLTAFKFDAKCSIDIATGDRPLRGDGWEELA